MGLANWSVRHDLSITLTHFVCKCIQIYAVIACTPIGVASLLAATILKSCSIISLLKALALYVATVIGGFLIHSTILLPLTLMVLSQNNPIKVIKYVVAAPPSLMFKRFDLAKKVQLVVG